MASNMSRVRRAIALRPSTPGRNRREWFVTRDDACFDFTPFNRRSRDMIALTT